MSDTKGLHQKEEINKSLNGTLMTHSWHSSITYDEYLIAFLYNYNTMSISYACNGMHIRLDEYILLGTIL
jgi:hypothetical protein